MSHPLWFDTQTGRIGDRNVISSILVDGPAHREGSILAGDEIVAVDGSDVLRMPPQEIRAVICSCRS